MSLFADLFSARRRSNPRIAVEWMVDLSVPNTDPQHWIELFATDLSAQGIRLQGLDADEVRRLLSYEGHALIKLRLPGVRPPLPLIRAELRWGLGEKNVSKPAGSLNSSTPICWNLSASTSPITRKTCSPTPFRPVFARLSSRRPDPLQRHPRSSESANPQRRLTTREIRP